MPVFVKYDGIAARNTQPLSSVERTTGANTQNRIIDVGDLPDGVKSQNQSSVTDTLDLSTGAREVGGASGAVDRVSLTPQPTPHPRPDVSVTEGLDTRA